MCDVRYANNLLKNPATKRLSGKTKSAFVADLLRRACLEAVAEIFDDLMVTMHEEDSDEVHIRILHAQLASTMWEVLVCCADHEMMGASALLDLCSDDVTLCSVIARHVFSVHLTVHASTESDQSQNVKRLLAVQESFTKAYCRLYLPSALWGPDSISTEESIIQLQACLQAHIVRLASAAVQMGVLPQLIDCSDFHLSWANAGIDPGISPVPLVLPVLLSRLVCTLAINGDSMVRRHIVLQIPALLAVADTFAELAIARLHAQAANSSDLLTASQAVMDAIIAIAGLGLHDESRANVEALATQFLDSPVVSADPALLSRVALTLLGASLEAERIGSSFERLTETQQAIFWQQARARCHLLNCSFEDVEKALQEPCGTTRPLPPFQESVEMIPERDCALGDPGELFEVNGTGEFPQTVLAMATVEEAMHRREVENHPSPPSLSALNLPVISGQKEVKRKAAKRLGRNDIERLRGVDPAEAPEDLRCAIDGRLLGAPVLSPYGHVFEKDTLTQWLTTCGSVCPITGKPLRQEADATTEQKVLDWVKAARASYKAKKQEKRCQRQAEMNPDEAEFAGTGPADFDSFWCPFQRLAHHTRQDLVEVMDHLYPSAVCDNTSRPQPCWLELVDWRPRKRNGTNAARSWTLLEESLAKFCIRNIESKPRWAQEWPSSWQGHLHLADGDKWDKYEGEWKDGLKHGRGTLTLAKNIKSKYEGVWEKGQQRCQQPETWQRLQFKALRHAANGLE
eukprot:symbB.v1.2.038388.t1/scaffold5957.1/size24395/2